MKFGHGSPIRAGLKQLQLLACLAIFALTCLSAYVPLCADETQLRARITWGGGVPKTWHGRIWIEGGSIGQKTVLSLDSKSPGSVFLHERQLIIHSPRDANFGAVDVDLIGDKSSRVYIEFSAIGPTEDAVRTPVRNSILLSELIDSPRGIPIDNQNNRVHIARSPGDKLRINTERKSMVFRPGEDFEFTVRPAHCNTSPSTQCKLRAQLFSNNGEMEWSEEHDVSSDPEGLVNLNQDFNVPMPLQGGAHIIQLTLYEPGNRLTFSSDRIIARRDVEFVVVPFKDPKVQQTSPSQWTVLQEIDPTQANWWDSVQQHVPIGRLAGFSESVMGNEKSRVIDNTDGRWLEIDQGGWHAFPLSIKNTGEPHLVEIEFSAETQLHSGISIIERDRTNQIPIFGVDSGIAYQPQDFAKQPTEKNKVKHRLLFWPNKDEPYLLITNHDTDNKCRVGRIKLHVGPSRITSISNNKNIAINSNRQSLVYFESPLFPENFGAMPGVDTTYDQSIDDWQMFYLGSDRFIQYLKHAGMQGAILTVASEGSSIYPSQYLEPTPKYDSGQFFSNGQDIMRKDVLGMVFEMFDREGLTLIPSIEFSCPIPELERIRRENGFDAAGIDLYHIHGHLLENDPNFSNHVSASYNPLHPEVQKAISKVVEELLQRYGHHKSFGGVSIKCGKNSYLTLPSQLWGYDLATVKRFMNEVGIKPPQNMDLESFTKLSMTQRAQWLLSEHRLDWLNWRAEKITLLFHELGDQVKAVKPTAKLFVTTVDMYQSDEARLAMSPSLRWSPDFSAFQLQMGIDQKAIASHQQIMWLDGHTDMPGWTLSESRVATEITHSKSANSFAKSIRGGGDLQVSRILWSEFDKLPGSSAISPNNPIIRAQVMARAHDEQRKFFAQRLALRDSVLLVHGGRLLPSGQESSLNQWLKIYQQLPAIPFEDVIVPEDKISGDSLVVRQKVVRERRYFYVVNKSPWPVSAELHFANETGHFVIESLDGNPIRANRQTNRATVRIDLEPYGLMGGITDRSVELTKWAEQSSLDIRSWLRAKSDRLSNLIQKAQNSSALEQVGNPDFNLETASGQPAQWNVGRQGNDRISIDSTRGFQSNSSLRMSSTVGSTWIRSQPFNPPETGRISIVVWLRIRQGAPQPPIRLAIEARHFGKEYYRFGGVGSIAGNKNPSPLNEKWQKYIVHFDDLPTEGLSHMQIGFDLMGPGEVWIDQVKVFDRWFDENDAKSLTYQIAMAQTVKIDQGNFESARQMLDGYWFKFLQTFVEKDPPVVEKERAVAHEAASPRFIDRVRGIVPRRFFRFR